MCPFSVGSAEGGGPGFVCVLVCAHVCVRVCMRGVCVYVCLWVCVCTYAQGLGQGLCVTLELVRKPATSYWKPRRAEACGIAPCGAHGQLRPVLGSTMGPVEGALHACCFITSPPQP